MVFLSGATATFDYPDCGFGSMPNAEVHHATLVILAMSTAHVMPAPEQFPAPAHRTTKQSSTKNNTALRRARNRSHDRSTYLRREILPALTPNGVALGERRKGVGDRHLAGFVSLELHLFEDLAAR